MELQGLYGLADGPFEPLPVRWLREVDQVGRTAAVGGPEAGDGERCTLHPGHGLCPYALPSFLPLRPPDQGRPGDGPEVVYMPVGWGGVVEVAVETGRQPASAPSAARVGIDARRKSEIAQPAHPLPEAPIQLEEQRVGTGARR